MIISYYYTGVGLGGIVNIRTNKEATVAMMHIPHPDLFMANSSLHTPLLSTLCSFLHFTQSTSSLLVYMAVHIQKCICLHLYIQNDYLYTKCVPLTESEFTELNVDFLHVFMSSARFLYMDESWRFVTQFNQGEDTRILPLYETLS